MRWYFFGRSLVLSIVLLLEVLDNIRCRNEKFDFLVLRHLLDGVFSSCKCLVGKVNWV